MCIGQLLPALFLALISIGASLVSMLCCCCCWNFTCDCHFDMLIVVAVGVSVVVSVVVVLLLFVSLLAFVLYCYFFAVLLLLLLLLVFLILLLLLLFEFLVVVVVIVVRVLVCVAVCLLLSYTVAVVVNIAVLVALSAPLLRSGNRTHQPLSAQRAPTGRISPRIVSHKHPLKNDRDIFQKSPGVHVIHVCQLLLKLPFPMPHKGPKQWKMGEAFLLTVGLSWSFFCLQLNFFAYSPLRPLLDALSHCKQKSSNCK